MEAWKKTAVVGSFAISAVCFLKKRWPAGVLTAGAGLAVLASEYPEKFEGVRAALPDYFRSGLRLMELVSRAGEKITQFSERGGERIWDEISS